MVSAAWISFVVSIVVLVIKFAAYLQTHSTAILSDALESIVNVVAATAALFVMKAVSEPADEEHPYGHGKLEYFSSAFEGGLIAFAAIVIGYGAIESLLKGSQLNEIDSGLIIMIGAGIVNLLLALHLYATGKKGKSEALIASAKHVMSDVVTTVGVILGLGLVKLTGWLWLDAVAAILVALHLLKEGVSIVRRSIGGLIDEMDSEALAKVVESFEKHRIPGFIDIHHLKVIRSGRFHHIDAHIVVPEFWNVAKTHQETHEFEEKVVTTYEYDGEIAFHVDPCKQQYCRSCSLENCEIRKNKFESKRDFTVERVIKGPSVDPEYFKKNG